MSKGSGVVITGLGVVSPIGIGRHEFSNSLSQGASGIRQITVFNPSLFKSHLGGEIINFNVNDFFPNQALEEANRPSKFLSVAVKLALDDAALSITPDNTHDIGIVTATTLSAIWNISEFSRKTEEDGPKFVSPKFFPGTTINTPSSLAAICFGIKGFNTTISTGFTAGLDALKYAVDFIESDQAQAILVCGVEELSFQTFAGFHKVEFLAGIKGEEISCPFDKRRNGIVLGEGAVALLIEKESFAMKRGAKLLAKINKVENCFDAFRSGKYYPKAEGLKRCIENALNNSGMEISVIDYVSASANSVRLQDKIEAMVINDLFKSRAVDIPVSAVKSMLGESLSVSGLFQVASSVCGMEDGFIPPTINYLCKDQDCDINIVDSAKRNERLSKVLVINFGPGGGNAAAIISK